MEEDFGQSYRLLLVLLVLAAGSWWLYQQWVDDTPTTTASGKRTIESFGSGLTLITLDQQGQAQRILRAKEMTHYRGDGGSDFVQPDLEIYREEGEMPWHIQSERGWLSPDRELIHLLGEVSITRAAEPDNPALHIMTSDLHYQLTQEYAETSRHVRIERENNWLEADGMQAWIGGPLHVKFLSNVTAYYQPE